MPFSLLKPTRWTTPLLLCALALGPSACSATRAPAIATSADHDVIERAVARVYPTLVRIFVVEAEADGGRMNRQAMSGSGAIISPEGHIITNHHVAGKAQRLVCRMSDGEEIEARLVGTDPLADIAVIKLDLSSRKPENAGKKLQVAEFGDSDALKIGDMVLAMGCPGGIAQSVTRGIVSNPAMIMPQFGGGGMTMDGEDTGSLVRWIAHDAMIYHGNSGGPLVDACGRIVGINEMGVANLGGAIPGNLAKSVAAQLAEKGRVDRSWTGIEAQQRPKGSTQERGVLVSGVTPDSPAQKAGIAAGDLLLSFNGTALDGRIPEDMPVFNRLVLDTPIGKTVAVTLLRAGKEETRTLTTCAREAGQTKDVELKDWVMTGRNLTKMEALELHRANADGVLITSIGQGGPCGQAKPELGPWDIITAVDGQPVRCAADLVALTQKTLAGKDEGTSERVPVLVSVERGTHRLLSVARIGKEPRQDPPKRPKRAWLPIQTQPITEDLAKALKLEDGTKGLRVTYVFPKHCADRAGMRVGDLLLKMDDEKLQISQPEEVSQFFSGLRQYDPGSEHTFDILRDGKAAQLKVALDASSSDAASAKRHQDDDFEFSVRELTDDDRVERQLPEDLSGVLVERVLRAGWANLAHLGDGDVILSIDGVATPDAATVKTALRAAKDKKARRILLFIRRGIHTAFLELEADWKDKPAQP